jgi:PAS domain S-box-containing protein
MNLIGRDYVYQAVNDAFLKALGKNREDVIGKTVTDIWGEETFKTDIKPLLDKCFSGQVESSEFDFESTETGLRYYEATFYPFSEGEADVELAAVVTSDITERKQAEMSLREEKEFSAGLLSTAQAIVLVLNNDATIRYFNPYMEQLSGYKLDEVEGRDWFTTFLPEGDWDEMRELFKGAISDVRTLGNINPIITRDGEERLIEWNDSTLRDSAKQVIGLLSVGMDITEKKKFGDLIQTEKDRYKKIIGTAQDGYWLTDKQGNLLEVNEAYCRMSGYSRDELLTMNVADLEANETPEETALHIRQIEEKGVARFETRHRCKDGRLIDVEISARALPVGDEIGGFVFIRDVTERKLATDALKEKLDEVERMNQLMIGRELKMEELRREIKRLKGEAG